VRQRLRIVLGVVAILLGGDYAVTSAALDAPLEDLATYPHAKVEIRSGTLTHTFDVWVADTPGRQQQGLMFVRELGPNQGMLFPGCCSGIWMKDCYIELDIVFIGAVAAAVDRRHDKPTKGKERKSESNKVGPGATATEHLIAKIAPRAQPHDETTIPAGGPVDAVLELKGGAGELLNLKAGDRVTWSEPR